MPTKPNKQCNYPGCPNLTRESYCDKHKSLHVWAKLKDTPRLRGRKLQRERNRLFDLNPLCVECLKIGRTTAATQRDHIVPLAEGGLDTPENTQGLCDECHNKKTQEESKRGKKILM